MKKQNVNIPVNTDLNEVINGLSQKLDTKLLNTLGLLDGWTKKSKTINVITALSQTHVSIYEDHNFSFPTSTSLAYTMLDVINSVGQGCYYTPHGLFKGKSSIGNLIEASNFIYIEINAKHNGHITNFDVLQKELSNLLNVVFLSKKQSNDGYFLLIKTKGAYKHQQYLDALAEAFKSFNIKIDIAQTHLEKIKPFEFNLPVYQPKVATVFHTILRNDMVRELNIIATSKDRY